jgi:hypothetical protein
MPADYTQGISAVLAADAAIFRTASGVRSFLSVVPPTTVLATGTVTGATLGASGEQNIALALSGLTVNSVAWPRNTTLWVGTAFGLHDVGIYRSRTAYTPGSNTINIGEAGLGDQGLLAQAIRGTELGGGLYISIMADFSPWVIAPKIIPTSTPPFFKDYSVAWNYQTTFPAPPIIVGPHTSLFSSGHGASATFTIATPNINPFVGAIKTPYTMVFTAPSSWSLISGSTTMTTTFTAISWSVPPGFHVLQITATATNDPTLGGILTTPLGPAGTTEAQTRYVCVWVYDGVPGDTGATFTPVNINQISNDQLTRDGSSMTIQLMAQDASKLRDGTLVNVFDVPYYVGGTPNQVITQRPGWVMSVESDIDPGVNSSIITIGGTGVFAKTMAANSQRVDAIDQSAGLIPASWQETVKLYCTPLFMIMYLLRTQTNLLELVDLHVPSDPYAEVNGLAFIVPKGNVWSQLQNVGERVQNLVTCDSQGGIWLSHNPQLLNYSMRSKSTAYNLFTTADYTNVVLTRNMRPSTGHVIAEGFSGAVYDSTVPQAKGLPIPLKSRAPGGSGGQGVSEETVTNLMVNGQTYLNELAGMYYAWKNNPYASIDISLEGNYWAWEPGIPTWNYLNVPASVTPDNIAYQNYVLLTNATRTHNENGTVSIKLTAEGETYGLPGVTEVIPTPLNPIPPITAPPAPPTKPNPCDGTNFPTGWTIENGILTSSPGGTGSPSGQVVKGVVNAVYAAACYTGAITSWFGVGVKNVTISYTFSTAQKLTTFSFSALGAILDSLTWNAQYGVYPYYTLWLSDGTVVGPSALLSGMGAAPIATMAWQGQGLTPTSPPTITKIRLALNSNGGNDGIAGGAVLTSTPFIGGVTLC